ncbi:hypothetical protein AOLI_G00257570 [Acnodon oligacanthus]
MNIYLNDTETCDDRSFGDNQLLKVTDTEPADHQMDPDLVEPELTDIHPLGKKWKLLLDIMMTIKQLLFIRDDRKNWGDEHRQVFRPRRKQEHMTEMTAEYLHTEEEQRVFGRDDRRNWGDERRQVFLPRRVQEQIDRRSTAVTDSVSPQRIGERDKDQRRSWSGVHSSTDRAEL